MNSAVFFGVVVAVVLALGCLLVAWSYWISNQRFRNVTARVWLALAIVVALFAIYIAWSSVHQSQPHQGVTIENPLLEK